MTVLWATATNVFPDLRGSHTILFPRQSMYPGESRFSPNELFKLQFQFDGNVVLLTNNLPDILVLWATNTDGMGGNEFRMQGDGNLIIYDKDDHAVWATNTAGEDAYLSLQNDGNLVIYSDKSLSPIATWSIPPDWADGVSETMAFMTAVNKSPTAIEQRLGLRRTPREMWELSFTVRGPTRTLFDLLTIRGGGSPLYLPIWQDQERLQSIARVGDLSIIVGSTEFTHFNTSFFLMVWRSPFDFDLAEIAEIDGSTIHLATGLTKEWLPGALVYPIKKCRFESQPNTSRRADRAFTARVRFITLADPNQGWHDIEDVPVVPTTGEGCVIDGFQWAQNISNGFTEYYQDLNTPDRLDQYGNYYVTEAFGTLQILVYSNTGALLNTVVPTELADMIDAWYGSAIVNRTNAPTYYDVWANPIHNGQYVLAMLQCYHSGSDFSFWWALLQPSADGSLSAVAAVRYNSLLGPPYVNGMRVFGALNPSSPIYCLAYFALGGTTATIFTLPSISQFGNYRTGFDTTYNEPCEIPRVIRYPLGDTPDLSDSFALGNLGNKSRNYGFILPGTSGINLYIYLNSSWMSYWLDDSNSVVACPEITNVIGPANPGGCMLKIKLGSHSFEELASTPYETSTVYRGLTTDEYTVDNASWRVFDGIGAAIPFSDEKHYISNGEPGGNDAFSLQTSVIERPGGLYWVIFYMVGTDDAVMRGDPGPYADPVYIRLRVFEYNPLSETARQIAIRTCNLHTDEDITRGGYVLSHDNYQIFSVTQDSNIVTIYLHGLIYKSMFARFTI